MGARGVNMDLCATRCMRIDRPARKARVAHPSRSSLCDADTAQVLEQALRQLVSRTECAQRYSQRVLDDLLALRLLAAPSEQDGQVERRDQCVLVFCAEQASHQDKHLALDLRGLCVLALS